MPMYSYKNKNKKEAEAPLPAYKPVTEQSNDEFNEYAKQRGNWYVGKTRTGSPVYEDINFEEGYRTVKPTWGAEFRKVSKDEEDRFRIDGLPARRTAAGVQLQREFRSGKVEELPGQVEEVVEDDPTAGHPQNCMCDLCNEKYGRNTNVNNNVIYQLPYRPPVATSEIQTDHGSMVCGCNLEDCSEDCYVCDDENCEEFDCVLCGKMRREQELKAKTRPIMLVINVDK